MSSSTRSQRSNGREAKEEKDEKSDVSKPVFTRKCWTGTGTVEIAVFSKEIEGDNGSFVVFNCVAKRVWKKDDKWESGNSFRPEDLLVLALFLQEAASFICNEQNKR